MASSHLIRLGAIKGKHGILEALKHNKRTLQRERGAAVHIDTARTPLNYSLTSVDDPVVISRHAKAQMQYAGIEKPRSNQVMAVEILFSLPVDRHSQDTEPFFNNCYQWTLNTFNGELLSFDIHLDESAPHAHAVILPLIDCKMQGNKMIGNKGNLMRLINLFHNEVAKHYGLSKADRKRLNNTDKQKMERLILSRLTSDSVMKSCVWACVRDAIHNDPLPFAQTLSIDLSSSTLKHKTVKSFVDIKRSHGKGIFQT